MYYIHKYYHLLNYVFHFEMNSSDITYNICNYVLQDPSATTLLHLFSHIYFHIYFLIYMHIFSYIYFMNIYFFLTPVAVDDDLAGLVLALLAQVLLGVHVAGHQLREEGDVADGQTQRVHLGQPLLVRQRRDVRAQPLERLVDALHPLPLPLVSGLSLVDLLLGAASASTPRLSGRLGVGARPVRRPPGGERVQVVRVVRRRRRRRVARGGGSGGDGVVRKDPPAHHVKVKAVHGAGVVVAGVGGGGRGSEGNQGGGWGGGVQEKTIYIGVRWTGHDSFFQQKRTRPHISIVSSRMNPS